MLLQHRLPEGCHIIFFLGTTKGTFQMQIYVFNINTQALILGVLDITKMMN